MFNYTSKINYANAQNKSLKAGIPKEIVKVLDIQAGNKLDWNVDVNNNKIIVTVKKLE